MIRHIYPSPSPDNGVGTYGQLIDPLLPKISKDVLHFEIGYNGWSELWQAHQNLKSAKMIPYVLTLHDPPVVVGKPFSRWLGGKDLASKSMRKILDLTIGKIIIRRVIKGASAIIVLNPLAIPVISKAYGVSSDIIHPHPLPPLLTPSAHRANSNTILFFGNISPRKGVHLLLEAFIQLNPSGWKLIICGGHKGEGGYINQLKGRISQAGLTGRVKFTGFVSDDRLSELISSSGIVILPYLDPGIIHASAPLINAMAHAKPIIASDIPIFSAVVRHKDNGLLFPPGDAAALATAIKSLISDGELMTSLARNAKLTADNEQSTRLAAQQLKEMYLAL